ncbi:MAG: PLP-dependent aspartate aminotransferase family protein [Gammaproteobacteria bacterium]
MAKPPNLSTVGIHPPTEADPRGAPHTPLYNTTTFVFPATAALLAVQNGEAQGGFYTRYGMNPTITALEAQLAALEQAERALAFGAGMAAISATCLAHGRGGVVCVGDMYGGTMELVGHQLPQLGIATRLLRDDEIAGLDETLRDLAPSLVLVESPSNPTLAVRDIGAIARTVHAHGALLAVDNTFATPVNQQPLALGADLVLHAATKYLGGHSDLTAGAVMGPAQLLQPIWNWRKNLGQVLAPEVASLLSRSLRTLVVRVERQNRSALAIAQALRDHPRVRRVHYPGLEESPGHDLARRQMRGFGGMVTLDLEATAEQATAVVDCLQLFLNAPSLGGVESLVCQPFATTHFGLSAEERARRGISDGMIRLSVGLEAVEDLIDDLNQALAEAFS